VSLACDLQTEASHRCASVDVSATIDRHGVLFGLKEPLQRVCIGINNKPYNVNNVMM